MYSEYRRLLEQGASVDVVLGRAYLNEEGIIDYEQLYETIASDLDVALKRQIERFSNKPFVKHYHEFAARRDAGASFEDIIASLEDDKRFFNKLDVMGLMMKLFNLSMEEYAHKEAAAHNRTAITGAELLIMSERAWDEIEDES